MKFYPLPDARGVVTREQLQDLAIAGIVQRSIGAFASPQHWHEVAFLAPPAEGETAKYWRDNSALWKTADQSYLMLARDGAGGFSKVKFNLSDVAFRYYSPVAAIFYNKYQSHFPVLPRLVRVTMEASEARRLNLAAPGPSRDYPVGIFTDETTHSFPANMALRFNPQNGQPEAFYIEDYVREFPLTSATPKKLSDFELVGAVEEIIESKTMTLPQKAEAIRALVQAMPTMAATMASSTIATVTA